MREKIYLFFSLIKKNIKISPHDPLREKRKGETDVEYLQRSINDFKSKIEKFGSDRIFAFVGEPIMGQLQAIHLHLKIIGKT